MIFRNAQFYKSSKTGCGASRKYFLVWDFGRDGQVNEITEAGFHNYTRLLIGQMSFSIKV